MALERTQEKRWNIAWLEEEDYQAFIRDQEEEQLKDLQNMIPQNFRNMFLGWKQPKSETQIENIISQYQQGKYKNSKYQLTAYKPKTISPTAPQLKKQLKNELKQSSVSNYVIPDSATDMESRKQVIKGETALIKLIFQNQIDNEEELILKLTESEMFEELGLYLNDIQKYESWLEKNIKLKKIQLQSNQQVKMTSLSANLRQNDDQNLQQSKIDQVFQPSDGSFKKQKQEKQAKPLTKEEKNIMKQTIKFQNEQKKLNQN